MSLFSILVDIQANTAQLVSGLDEATSHLESFGKSFERIQERAVEWTAAYASIGTLKSLITDVTDRGQQLELLSQRLGASAESLSRLEYAAKVTQIPFEQLTSSLDMFHEQLGRAAEGSGRSQKALAALGIDAKKLLDLPFDQQLAAVADRLAQIANPSQRAAFEMQLFGETGARLDPILSKGAEGIAELGRQADAAGYTLDGKMVQGLHDTREALDKMDAAVEGAATHLVANLAPAISGAAGLLQDFLKGLDAISASIAHGIAGAPTLLGRYSDDLAGLAKKRDNLIESIRELQATEAKLSTHEFDSTIDRARAELKAVEEQMNAVNAHIIAIQQNAEAAAKPKPKPDIAAGPSVKDLDEARVTAQRYHKTYYEQLDDFYNSLDALTETETERQVAEYDKKEAALDALRAEGLISAQEYQVRLAEILDNTLKPVAASLGDKDKSANLLKETKPQFDALTSMADEAARKMQDAFANFLFDPFKGGVRGMAVNFLQALHKMVAEAAARDIFKALFGEGDGGKDSSGLGGLFRKMLGDSGEGAGRGGGGGGGGAEPSLLGVATKGLTSVITGLLYGGGSTPFAGLTQGAAQDAAADLTADMTDFGGALSGISSSAVLPDLAGALAGGGDANPGETYLVGEEGPELFTPSAHGTVIPNGALGQTVHYSPTFHIDARGADADRVMTLVPPLVAQQVARSKADILNAFRRSGLAAPIRA